MCASRVRPCPQARIPERIVEKAIVGMLPKNSHGRKLFTHLKVYKGAVRDRTPSAPSHTPGGRGGERTPRAADRAP